MPRPRRNAGGSTVLPPAEPLTEVYCDKSDAGAGSVFNQEHVRRMLRRAYRDSAAWVDLERIALDVSTLVRRGDPAQAERFFLNRTTASADVYMPEEDWQETAAPRVRVPAGTLITIGFDGSLGTAKDDGRVADSTVMRGCVVETGHLFTLGVWEHINEGPWEPPRREVRRTLDTAMGRYRVALAYCDPQHWQSDIGDWAEAYGEDRVVEWWTNRDTPMASALERLYVDIKLRRVTHDANKRVAAHYRNARRHVKPASANDPDNKKERVLVRKENPNSPLKIDSVVTDALAYEARADAIARGLTGDPADQAGDFYAWGVR